MSRDAEDLFRRFRDLGIPVQRNEQLKKHTSFKLGGPADLWVEPATVDMMAMVLREATLRGYPLICLGGGTNVIFPDEGFPGIVLSTLCLTRYSSMDTGITAQAGVPLSRVVSLSISTGMDGMAELTGIPGSTGGAVSGNAGACGRSIGTVVDSIDLLDSLGTPKTMKGSSCGFAYRTCHLPEGHIITAVRCALIPGNPQKIRSTARRVVHERVKKQPLNERSAGCIFKNPLQQSAGRLIEEVGMKGFRIGGARISERHANWIIVDETARSDDVLNLIERTRHRVFEERGVMLESEIDIIGNRV